MDQVRNIVLTFLHTLSILVDLKIQLLKYLTIKDTRAILIRYIILVFLSWLILVLLKDGETLNMRSSWIGVDLDVTVVRPHMAGIVILLLASFITAHAMAYQVSRQVNNGRRRWTTAIKALLISWTLVSFVFLFIVSKFSVTNYVIATSVGPLILFPFLSWELRRASHINSQFK